MTTARKQGWFTRLCRDVLEEIWEEHYLTSSEVNRYVARGEGWDDVAENDLVSPRAALRLIEERFISAEQRILKSNQDTFRRVIRELEHDLRVKVLEETDNPEQLTEDEVEAIRSAASEHLEPIAEKFIRRPGADKDFQALCKVGDIDFEDIYDMVVVRDSTVYDVSLSVQDYNFMDRLRRALKTSVRTKLGELFGRAKGA